MSSSFSLNPVSSKDGKLVLKAVGQLEAAGAQLLIKECRVHAASDAKLIRIDLSEVTVISSSGIGGLLLVQEDLEASGKTIEFVKLSREVLSVVQLMDLDSLMHIELDESRSGS